MKKSFSTATGFINNRPLDTTPAALPLIQSDMLCTKTEISASNLQRSMAVRLAVLSVVVLVACGFPVAAQNPNSGNSGAKSTQTIRGCLTKTGNTYVILHYTPMLQYRVIGGDIAAFKGKENKIVEVTGLVGEKESGAGTNGQYGPGSTTGVGYDTIIAKSVKVVVDNCS